MDIQRGKAYHIYLCPGVAYKHARRDDLYAAPSGGLPVIAYAGRDGFWHFVAEFRPCIIPIDNSCVLVNARAEGDES